MMARARRLILGPVAFIFCLAVVVAIYLAARNRQRNHGPVESEAEFWKKWGGVPKPYTGGHHYRRHD
jgi:hypothetical protein